MKKTHKFRTLAFLLVTNSLICFQTTLAQDFPNSPKEILKSWDYYRLIEKLGEGSPIIDTINKQAYIAGMAYKEVWLSRDAELSYYFRDINISNFQLRFWSPYISQRTEGRLTNVTDPGIRDSLLRAYQIEDSIRMDSVSRLLRVDPVIMEDFKAKAAEKNLFKKQLYDLDSLRCDSIIEEISAVLGPPLRQGRTHHTDKGARYSAVWMNKEIAVSLRDFTDYTDISFSIPQVSPTLASSFDLDPDSEVIRKFSFPIKKEEVSVSLLAVPQNKEASRYSRASLLVEYVSGQKYVEKFNYDQVFSKLEVNGLDFNKDGLPEIWISAQTDSTSNCGAHGIFTLEAEEPILVFDSFEEAELGISGRLLKDHQIEIILADGTRFISAISPLNKAIREKHYQEGSLKQSAALEAECLHYLKTIQTGSKSIGLEGSIRLVTAEDRIPVCELKISWDLVRGIWEVVDHGTIDLK